MELDTFRNYCLSKKGAEESIPFSKLPSVLVFKIMGKMFAVTDIDDYNSIVLKFDPDELEEYKAQYSALSAPAYFSAKHWCNIALDGSVKNEEICGFIDKSYALIVEKLSKAQKAELSTL